MRTVSKIQLIILFSFCVISFGANQISLFDDFENTLSTYYEQIASFENIGQMPYAVEGTIVSFIDGKLILAGGIDQSGKPVADVYWAYIDNLQDWNKAYLEYPIAFAAVVVDEEKIICIGGLTAEGFSKDVFTLRFQNETLIQEKADWQLPNPAACSAAAIWGQRIFIIGGLVSNEPKTFNKKLHIFHKNRSEFTSIDLPDLQLENPSAVSQNDGVYVIDNKQVHKITYEHVAGVKIQRLLNPPVDLGVVSLSPIGQSHIFVASAAYTKSPLMYHTITDTFTEFDQAPGGALPAAVSAEGETVFIADRDVYKVSLNQITGLMRTVDYAIVGIYLAALVGVGFYFSKREKSTENFFVGGRKVPTIAVAFSLFATGTSGISFMAIPAKSYMTDLLFFGAVLISVFFNISIAFIMPYLRGLEITSIYEYLEMRFDKVIRLAGASVCLVYEIGARMSVAMYIPAVALTAVTGIDITVSILVMGVLATAYTVLGGIEAVIWSDVIQSVVMIGGALVAAVLLISGTEGGVSGYVDMSSAYNKFRVFDFRWDYTLPVVWVMAANCFAVAVQNISNQSMLQRIFCTRDPKQARNSQLMSVAVGFSMAVVFWGIGTMLFTYFKSNPASLIPALPDDSVFPLFIVKNIPVGLCGLVIAGLFSAAMSTLDSSMNTASAVVVTDFYSKIKPQASEQSRMMVARWTTVFVGVLGTALALLLAGAGIKSIFDIWMTLASLLLSSLPAVMVLGLFTKRTGTVGAYVAIGIALVAAVIVKQTPMHFFLYSFSIIVVAAVCGYAVSFIFPEKRNLTGLTLTMTKR